MKKLIVSDLAAILQLDQTYKDELVKNFDSYDNNLKYEILDVLWNGIHELKRRLSQLKYEQFLVEVDAGRRKLTANLYDEAKKAVWHDFEDILSGKTIEISQIESIRAELKIPNPNNSLSTSNQSSPTPPVQKA